jgi:hypothetical protein
MSKIPLKINSIRTKLLTVIDSDLQRKNIKKELPSLNKSTLDYQKNIQIEMKDYSHSLQKIMRGFNTFFKGNTLIQFKRKEKNKFCNSTKHACFKNNIKYPFRYLEYVCSMVIIPIKKRTKTEINTHIKVNSDDLISKKKENSKIIDYDIIMKI